MTDDLEHLIKNGRRLQIIMDDPNFKAFCDRMKESIIAEWTQGKSPQDRELAFHKLNGINWFLQKLKGEVDSGVYSEAQLKGKTTLTKG